MGVEPTAEMKTAAEQLARTFADTWNQQDGETYGEAYWLDAELVDPTGQVWDGRPAIAAMHVDLWNGPARDSRVSTKVRRIRPIGTNAMVLDLEIVVSGFSPPPPGASVDQDGCVKARLKHVVEMRAGEWKIAASQNTFVAAMQPR